MKQMADWLEKLGMSEYAQRFAENGIDVSVLRDLTNQELRQSAYCSAIAERCCAFGELGSSQVPTSRQCGFVELARDNLTYGFSFSALMRPVSRD
jgi:SAM domain (Sterile alpha motif)